MERTIQWTKKYLIEEEIYTAVTVCALFNFYNKWVDGHGVAHCTPEQYEQTGERLAKHGYVL